MWRTIVLAYRSKEYFFIQRLVLGFRPIRQPHHYSTHFRNNTSNMNSHLVLANRSEEWFCDYDGYFNSKEKLRKSFGSHTFAFYGHVIRPVNVAIYCTFSLLLGRRCTGET